MSSSLLLALLVNRSPTERLIQNILNNPFAGIHQLAWFDWAMLIPYFTVLFILSVYGLHRYDIIRTYFKHKKKKTTEPAKRFEQLPRVTIQLPLYNERYVVERLIEETVKMDYPKELLQIQVLDDSTDDTAPFADALVERYRTLGYPIEYHHRTNRHGFKAGALQEGLKTATGEMVAVFDADFIPPTDFLTRTIHYFTDPTVGVVQTRWSYLNRDYNFLTEVEGMLLDGHFILEHGARSLRRILLQLQRHGRHSARLHDRRRRRLAARYPHRGFRPELSRAAQGLALHVRARPGLPLGTARRDARLPGAAIALGQGPDAGRHETAAHHPEAPISRRVKMEAFMHLTPNISYPLMIVVSALMLPVMIVRFYMGVWQMMFLDLPLIVASFWSISLFYVVAQRELYPKNWKRSIFMLPMLMAVGVGLTIINTRAVLEALFGVETSFVRTPKFAIGERPMKLENKQYRARSGWLPYLEIAVGTYFLGMVVFAITTFNFLSIPFLALFVFGYYWAGFTTLYQEHQSRLRWMKARNLELARQA